MTTALVVGLGLVVALLAVLVVGLLRSHADILRALHDLGVNLEDGAPAPRSDRARAASSTHPPARTAPGVASPRSAEVAFGSAVDVDGDLPTGGAAHVALAGGDQRTVLAFLSTGCGTCGVFWEDLQDPERALPVGADRLVIITNGPEQESPAAVADVAPPGVVTVMSTQAWDDYDVPVSPYFVLVDGRSSKVIGEGAGTSWAQVSELLERAVADAGVADAPAPRPVAPALHRMGGQDRAEYVDEQLRQAGIAPGDPSLYP